MFLSDPKCLSLIQDSALFHPGSRIQSSNNNKKGGKIFLTYIVTISFTKLKIIFFKQAQKTTWANWQIIEVFYTQNIVTKPSEKWVWDQEKTYLGSGSRDQKSTGSRIRNTGYMRIFFHLNGTNSCATNLVLLWCVEELAALLTLDGFGLVVYLQMDPDWVTLTFLPVLWIRIWTIRN